MKSTFFLLGLALSLLDVADSAPFRLPQNLQLPSLDNTNNAVKPITEPIHYKDYSETLVRRAPGWKPRGKAKKTDEQKKKDATQALQAGPSINKATKEKEVADKKAAVASKKTEVEDKVKEKEKADADLDAGMTDRQRKTRANQQDKEDEAKKEWEERKKREKDDIHLEVRAVKDKDIERFWKEFSKPQKGLDGTGWVHLDDIAAAFRKCVPKDKFLFWSSGSDNDHPDSKQDFGRVINLYQERDERMKIAKALHTDDCKKADLDIMQRDTMIRDFHNWIEAEQKEDYLRKNPGNKAKKIHFRWPFFVAYNADGTLNYRHYWAVMSAGFAAGATGEVHYVRPDRKQGEKGDYAGKHWADLEFPQLKKNKLVTSVVEVNVAYSPNGKYPKKGVNIPITQTIVRKGPGAVEV